MRSWLATVFAAIAMAGPALAGEDMVGRAEARREVKARLEQEHAHRLALVRIQAEQQAAIRRDVLRAAADRAAPRWEAPHYSVDARIAPPRLPSLTPAARVAAR